MNGDIFLTAFVSNRSQGIKFFYFFICNRNTTNTDTTIEVPQDPEVASTDPGVGQMSGGGMGAMGATKLGRARSRLQRLGIIGRGTGLLGRGLQYGNALNMF